MRANQLLSVISFVVAGSLALAATAERGIEVAHEHQDGPDLSNFLRYKELFNKTYSSMLEETDRARYVAAAAMRAFRSAISFQFRYEDYYLAVNHLSDHSPAELEMMDNHMLDDDLTDRVIVAPKPMRMPSPRVKRDSPPEDEEEEGHGAAHHRKLPSQIIAGLTEALDYEPRPPPRRMSMHKLMNTGADAELEPETQAKVVEYVPSDNPHYRGIELPTQGIVDQQQPVSWYALEAPTRAPNKNSFASFLGGVSENLVRTFNPKFARQQDEIKRRVKKELERKQDEERRRSREQEEEDDDDDDDDQADEGDEAVRPGELTATADDVFVDLRRTNCWFLPRHQGRCGSCYAFATIAVMEFLRCRKTGQLVALSEQYMVDCGTEYVKEINGCKGGRPTAMPVFVRNFGLHLRNQYPYRARVDQCPYDLDTDPKQTGYLRARDFSTSVRVPMELWPKALKHGPLLVAIATGQAFKEFGGGLYTGKECPPKATHAVLIVGHGRADNGREYWLVRNSYGTGWGEQGYMRLDKQADCIHPAVGYAFGVSDPKFFDQVEFSENSLHKPIQLERI